MLPLLLAAPFTRDSRVLPLAYSRNRDCSTPPVGSLVRAVSIIPTDTPNLTSPHARGPLRAYASPKHHLLGFFMVLKKAKHSCT